MKIIWHSAFCILFSFQLFAVKIDRVILGCDSNPMYLEFWPIVAKTWTEIVGVRPTLALIAHKDVCIDETLGDVIRFEPIPNISTAFQAQIMRLLLPAYFENDVCIISDMDMIPLQRDFFVNNVATVPAESFTIFNDGGRYLGNCPEYLMCYIVAKGKTFKEIFKISDIMHIPEIIKAWYQLNLGWTSDQQILYAAVNQWEHYKTRVIKLGYAEPRRIDRMHWSYDRELLKQGHYYVDSHMLRPYSRYKNEIDSLVKDLFELKI